MKCREVDNKCQCKTCNNMKNCYCEYFKTNSMCNKCDYHGHVVDCLNKKVIG